jgi:hypothetical protein
MKQKIILILIFVSSLIITFTPDMACNMIIIGLKEFDTFSNLKSLKYDNVILLIGLILMLFGQVSLIYSIIRKTYGKTPNLIHFGLLCMILALIIIGTKNTVDYGNVWIITVLTILPFLGLSVYFYFAYFKKGNPLKNNL